MRQADSSQLTADILLYALNVTLIQELSTVSSRILR